VSVVDQYQSYLAAGTSFARLAPPVDTVPKKVYGTFNEDQRDLLFAIDTGPIFCDTPYLMKYFHVVRFSGSGKIYIRALVDQTEVARGWVVLSEDPSQSNLFRLPRGTSGYSLRLQMAGIAKWRFYDIEWDPVAPGEV
jgi:hypothetical protein